MRTREHPERASLLGYPDQARQSIEDALAAARTGAYHVSVVLSLRASAAIVFQLQHDMSLARERAEMGVRLCTEHGIPLWLAITKIIHGWALVAQGQVEAGVTQLEQGIAVERTTEVVGWAPYHLALLAEAYGHGGDGKEGLRVITEALAAVHNAGARFYEAELWRLKGELLLQQRAQRAKAAGQKSKISRAPHVARRRV